MMPLFLLLAPIAAGRAPFTGRIEPSKNNFNLDYLIHPTRGVIKVEKLDTKDDSI